MSAVKVLVDGHASGPLLRLDEPVSFWGGVDPTSGEIVEPGHPQYGENVAGKIVAMPHGRGSSSASSVLAELLRIGRGPAGIVLEEPDSILVVGVLVAAVLYGARCPVVVAGEPPRSGGEWTIAEGTIVQVGAASP